MRTEQEIMELICIIHNQYHKISQNNKIKIGRYFLWGFLEKKIQTA